MKVSILVIIITTLVLSCSNGGNGDKPFCSECKTDSLTFKGDHKLQPRVSISLKKCVGDTLNWGHYLMDFEKRLALTEFLGQKVNMSPDAVNCFIKDTSYAWLTFNDCSTGRGFLIKLPFRDGVIGKYTGALNYFDPKFRLDKNLRAYTVRGSVFVVNIETGKEAAMTFQKAYDIDFNKIHEVVDSVNITAKRIYVKLIKEGVTMELQKNVDL